MGEVQPNSRSENDAELVALCQRGDRAAFARLYSAHKDRVYSLVLHFFRGNESLAADITQRVFLELIDGIRHFNGGSLFTTWLYRLVYNKCVDAARKRRPEEPALHLVDRARSPFAELEQKQMSTLVQAAIAELPEPFRMAVLLRHFEEMSYEDMAAALDCSAGTVASRLSRAHRLLAEKLAPVRSWLSTKE